MGVGRVFLVQVIFCSSCENLERFLAVFLQVKTTSFLCNFLDALPETNVAPKNGWLEYDRFLLGWPIFRGDC